MRDRWRVRVVVQDSRRSESRTLAGIVGVCRHGIGARWMSMRFQKRLRKAQRARSVRLKMTPPGPLRIGLLIEFARPMRTPSGNVIATRGPVCRRRQGFLVQKRAWLGEAGVGCCSACGRPDRMRVWHHICQLQHMGSNSPRNLLKICHECHAQIHPHLTMTETVDEDLYQAARLTTQRSFDARPRLVKRT